MADLTKTFLYRMTHIENVPHILQYGITHRNSPNANPAFVPIGDASLIRSRDGFRLSNGRLLGEYIPFYFGVRSPMLYVIQNGFNTVAPTPPEAIIYCVTSVQKILDLQLDFVFTDGHAVDRYTTQYFPEHIHNVDTLVDRKAVMATYWKDEKDLDKKRRKEAEFLVFGDIAPEALVGFVVYNAAAAGKLAAVGAKADRIKIEPDYYF